MQTVDVVKVLTRRMHFSEHAALCAVSHGQVFVDERCIGMNDRDLDVETERGKLLTIRSKDVPFRAYRLGSRRVLAPEQGTLA